MLNSAIVSYQLGTLDLAVEEGRGGRSGKERSLGWASRHFFSHSLALYKSLFTYLLCVLSIPVVDVHYVQTAAVSGNVAHATRMVQL